MQAMKHLRAQNPIYPQFQPMQLYEKVAVRRCQILLQQMRFLCLFLAITLNN